MGSRPCVWRPHGCYSKAARLAMSSRSPCAPASATTSGCVVPSCVISEFRRRNIVTASPVELSWPPEGAARLLSRLPRVLDVALQHAHIAADWRSGTAADLRSLLRLHRASLQVLAIAPSGSDGRDHDSGQSQPGGKCANRSLVAEDSDDDPTETGSACR